MKKFRLFMAALISASVVASGAALTACGGDGDEGSDNKPIDEATWQAAFDELDYTNVTFRTNSDGIVMLSENSAYYKNQHGDTYLDEAYSVNNGDGTYTNYVRNYREDDYGSIENASFSCSIDSYGKAFNWGKESITFTASYKDDYKSFKYDEDLQAYVYSGAVEAVQTFYEELSGGGVHDDVFTSKFADNVVKILNDKIIAYSFRVVSYSCVCNCSDPSYHHNQSDVEVNALGEYFDIGTTVVEIPEELLDMRPWNLPDLD